MLQLPVLRDMLGARCEFVYAEPYAQSPIILTGTIVELKECYDGTLHIRVKPDNVNRVSKWRVAELHLLRYLYNIPQIEKATA